MRIRIMIGLTAALAPGVAMSDAAGRDLPHAELFADAVWDYVKGECPSEVLLNDEVNSAIFYALEGPFNDYEDLPNDERHGVMALQVLRKNLIASQMTAQDKRAFAQTVIGAYAVREQLIFMNTVAEADHLGADDYLSVETELKTRANASLALMKCVSPTAEDLAQLSSGSGMGLMGDAMTPAINKILFEGLCKIDFFTLAQAYLDTNFANVPPAAREQVVGEIIRSHGDYLETEQVVERCEELS